VEALALTDPTRGRPSFERVRRGRRRAQLTLLEWRPRTRGDCASVERPCLYVACKHNLYLDVLEPSSVAPFGTIKTNFASPADMPRGASCVLDVAEAGPHTLEECAVVMQMSDERCRQIDLEARAKFVAGGGDRLRDLALQTGVVAFDYDEQEEPPMSVDIEGWELVPCQRCGQQRFTPLGVRVPSCPFCPKETTKMPAKTKSNGAIEKVERGRFHKKLPVPILQVDVAARAKELATVVAERLALKSRQRAANSVFREQRSYYDEREKELSASVTGGTELKDVECVAFLLPTNEVQVTRLDTGEVIETRTASKEELQEPLGGTKDGWTTGPNPQPVGGKKKRGRPKKAAAQPEAAPA
jgi:hypothetical protein